MLLTLAQMISRATTLAGGRLDWDASDASFYVNQGIAYVAKNIGVQHRSLESSYATTITSGVSRMRLPADYNWTVALSVGSAMPASASTNWSTLQKRDIGWADTFAGRLDATAGRPQGYVEYGDTFFEIVPAPASSLSLVLRFQRHPSELTLSASTCELTDQWHWAATLKASELLAMSRGDYELEQIARNRYIDYMSTVMTDQDKKWMDQRGALQPRTGARSADTARL
jgi:hypothetical protein